MVQSCALHASGRLWAPCKQQVPSVHVSVAQAKESAATGCHGLGSAAADGDFCNQEICGVSETARKGADLCRLEACALRAVGCQQTPRLQNSMRQGLKEKGLGPASPCPLRPGLCQCSAVLFSAYASQPLGKVRDFAVL